MNKSNNCTQSNLYTQSHSHTHQIEKQSVLLDFYIDFLVDLTFQTTFSFFLWFCAFRTQYTFISNSYGFSYSRHSEIWCVLLCLFLRSVRFLYTKRMNIIAESVRLPVQTKNKCTNETRKERERRT